MDDKGKIWIGTFENELICYDPLSKEFKFFPKILQGDIGEIYSINYSHDMIWLGTNVGLYRFNIKTNDCIVFKETDGTQENVYYPLAAMKGSDGLLYFGGTGGFTIVDPKKISLNPIKPNIIISDFYIDNEPALDRKKQISTKKQNNLLPKPLYRIKNKGSVLNYHATII